MTRLHFETEIAAPIERCFDLSRSVDLHELSMKHTGERAIAGVTHGLMSLGDSVTWEARHFRLRLRLTTSITEFSAPDRFVDEQRSGAFRTLRHVHEFREFQSRTLMTDDFAYTVPFGVAGVIFNALVLRRYMERLLRTRNEALKHVAEDDALWMPVLGRN